MLVESSRNSIIKAQGDIESTIAIVIGLVCASVLPTVVRGGHFSHH